jgi:hypothetical protein
VECWHLQGSSPRLCQLRTDGLALRASIKCTYRMLVFMGLVSLVVCHRQELSLRILLHWLARERNWVRTHRSVSRHAMDSVGSPFSREQWVPSKSIGGLQRVTICGPCETRMVLGHMRTERGKHVACWLGFPLQGVYRFESSRLSDMSNCLFVAVIT